MEWLLRFFLGLPPDAEGRSKGARLLEDLDRSTSEAREHVPVLVFWPPDWPVGLDPEEFAGALRAWLARGPSERSVVREVPAASPPTDEPRECPLGAECPRYRTSSRAADAQTASTAPSDDRESEARGGEQASAPLEFLRAGGAAAGQGTKAFLDLVQKTKHCHGEEISTLVITDRYFHASLGEDGSGNGYGVLLDLLEVLGVRASKHPLTLQISPECNADKTAAFARRICAAREGLTVQSHASVRVHDRFYLIKSGKSVRGKQLSGVFGPSLNGLEGGLYVMGSFETEPLKKVATVLNL